MKEQQRKVPRFPFHWKATVVFDERDERPRLNGHTKDISIQGCAILTDHNVFSNYPVTILLQLPIEHPAKPRRLVEVKGRMVYTVLAANHHQFRFGIEFTKFTPGSRELLQTALDDRSSLATIGEY